MLDRSARVVIALFLCTLAACGSDGDPADPGRQDPPAVPTITEVDPANLTEGTITRVFGENFGASGQLFLNGDEVAASSWSNTMVMFTVPSGISGTQVDITVRSGGQASAVFQVDFFEPTEHQLTFDGLSCSAPCWSQDGSEVYFQAQGPGGTAAFYAVPFEGGATRLLYDGGGEDMMLDVHHQTGNVLWINDERLASASPDGDWEVWEGSAGFNPRGYAVHDHLQNTTNERWPAWNHQIALGVRFAWSQDRQGGNSQIYVLHNDDPKPLVAGMLPRFCAHDGDRLTYLTQRGPGDGYDINVISVALGSVGQPIHGGPDVTPAGLDWSVGGKIAFIRAGPRDVWVMNEDGTGLQAVTSNPENEYQPRFSPDGRWVAFIRHVTTEGEVFVARVP